MTRVRRSSSACYLGLLLDCDHRTDIALDPSTAIVTGASIVWLSTDTRSGW
jgi:hypothetical protein